MDRVTLAALIVIGADEPRRGQYRPPSEQRLPGRHGKDRHRAGTEGIGYNPLVTAAGIARDRKNTLIPFAPWT
jgi:hypothetical protein